MRPKIIIRFLLFSILIGQFFSLTLSSNLKIFWPFYASIIIVFIIIGWLAANKFVWLGAGCAISLIVSLIVGASIIRAHKPKDGFIQTSIVGQIIERPVLDDKQKIVLKVDETLVLINLPRYPEYRYGQSVEVIGKLEEPAVFPDFNYKNYLLGRNIYFVVNRAESVKVVSKNGSSKIKEWLYFVAGRFEETLNKSLPEPEASFAAGLLLGSKRGLSDELVLNLQRSGTSHLVAISGYNITIIVVVLSMLLTPFGRRLGFILNLVVICAFVILTGGSASVVRGAIIGLITVFAKVINRRADLANILLLSAVGIIFTNPYKLLYDAGFLLSYAAFIGIVYLAPHLRWYAAKKHLPVKFFAVSLLIETLSAQIFALPLLIYFFGQLSIIAPITNILILPVIPLAMGLIAVAGLAGLVVPLAGQWLGYLSWPFLKYPLFIIEYFGRMELSAVVLPGKKLWLFIIMYLVIITYLYLNRKRVINEQST